MATSPPSQFPPNIIDITWEMSKQLNWTFPQTLINSVNGTKGVVMENVYFFMEKTRVRPRVLFARGRHRRFN
jgi:hypothetical protein